MSAITKILVVVLVVFCVAFSMASISLIAQQDNWKSLAEDYRREAQISAANQRSLAAAHSAELAGIRDQARARLDRIDELEQTVQEQAQSLARHEGTIAQLTADRRSADALAQRLTNELGIAQESRKRIDEQRGQLEGRNIELERRNIDLNERVNELSSQAAVFVQQQRQQAQQINILQDENQNLSQQTGIAPSAPFEPSLTGVAPRQAMSTPRINGRVVAVDGDHVTISVGSTDNVGKGMVFVVYRGGQYVGDVEISDVEPNLSAGRLVSSSRGVSSRKGDSVVDAFHFAQP